MASPEIPSVRINPACDNCEIVGLCMESIGRQVAGVNDAIRESLDNWQTMRNAKADEWEDLQSKANRLNESMGYQVAALEGDIEVFEMYHHDCPGLGADGCGLNAEERYLMLPRDLLDDQRAQELKEQAFGSPD